MTLGIDGWTVLRCITENKWIAYRDMDGERLEADTLDHLIIKIDQEGIE